MAHTNYACCILLVLFGNSFGNSLQGRQSRVMSFSDNKSGPNSSDTVFTDDFASDVNKTRDKYSRALFHNDKENELDSSFDVMARSLTGVTGRNEDTGLARLGEVLGLHGLTNVHIIKGGLLLLAFALPLLLSFIPSVLSKFSHYMDSNSFAYMGSHLARNVLNSESCVERISCEIGRASHAGFIDRFVVKTIYKLERFTPNFMRRIARAYLDRTVCNKYACALTDKYIILETGPLNPQSGPPPPPPFNPHPQHF